MKTFIPILAVPMLAVLLSLSLALTGCHQSSEQNTTPQSNSSNSTAKSAEGVAGSLSHEALMQKQISNLNDVRLYCFGMMLYAQKHGNVFPTNLDQTLPYLTAPNVPTGTNHFEILYHGTLAQLPTQLPNPITNGIILLRSDPWQRTDGTWARAYGFADGHAEIHFEPGGNFTAWEKQNSLNP